MEHQTKFIRGVLPHYLKVVTSVVTLDQMVSRAGEQELSEAEENRLRTAVTTAHTEIKEAVAEGRKVAGDVDAEIQAAAEQKRGIEQEIESKRGQLLQGQKQLVTLENQKEKMRDELEGYQLEIRQTTESQNAENARKAQKETLRNMGFGLLILPFVGIPLTLGATREMKHSEALIKSATESKATLEVTRDRVAEDLAGCQKKLQELRQEQLEMDNCLRGKERELREMQEPMNQLFSSRRKVLDALDHLTALEAQLDILSSRCQPDSYPGFELVQGRLQQLTSFVHSQSFGFQLLGDPRVLSKLSQLDGKGQN